MDGWMDLTACQPHLGHVMPKRTMSKTMEKIRQ